VQNDAGQWQYINSNGKAVTSNRLTTDNDKYYFDDKSVMVYGKWLQIGGKQYCFDADGKPAVSTTIDGYNVGA
jgi:glucan-binding YG repeat protein